MQIFVPYADLERSVQVLDKYRLGNQIWRECTTLLNGGWTNHPVSKMWMPYKHAMALYMHYGLIELRKRRAIPPQTHRELVLYIRHKFPTPSLRSFDTNATLPPFIGDEEFHRSHRLALLHKYPQWYSRYFTEPVPESYEYKWPI